MLFWEQYSHEPYIAVCRLVMLYLGKPAAEREEWRVRRGEGALDHMNGLPAAGRGAGWLAAGAPGQVSGQHEFGLAEPLDIQKGRQVAMIDAGAYTKEQ